MKTIKIVLWPVPTEDGFHQIQIKITKDRKSTYFDTGIWVSKSHWDTKTCRVRDNHPESKKYNDLIDNFLKQYLIQSISQLENSNQKNNQLIESINNDTHLEGGKLSLEAIINDPNLLNLFKVEYQKNIEKRAKEEQEEITQYLLSPSVQKQLAFLEILHIVLQLQTNVIPLLLEGLGYINVEYDSVGLTEYSATEYSHNFTASNKVKGSIVFPKTMKENDPFKIVVNGQQVWPLNYFLR